MTGETFQMVQDKLLAEIQTAYEGFGKLSDELMSALNFVFQAPLMPALDLVDNREVTLLTSPSGRSIYQVIGSSGTPYTCFISSLFCSCPAYRFSVLHKGDHPMCKHQLAVKLCEAMNLCKQLPVEDGEITSMIEGID